MAQAQFANADREYREIKAKQKELGKLQQKYFPKVDRGLLNDLIEHAPNSKENNGRLYEIQVIAKKGTDPEKVRSFFMEKTGKVPTMHEDGTHYRLNEYATLGLIKEIQNMKETEHIMGDYTFGAYAFSQRHMHRGEDEGKRITE